MSETTMSEATWQLQPAELSAVLDGLEVADRQVRDLLAFVAGRDPEVFALATWYATHPGPQSGLLPARIAEQAEAVLMGSGS